MRSRTLAALAALLVLPAAASGATTVEPGQLDPLWGEQGSAALAFQYQHLPHRGYQLPDGKVQVAGGWGGGFALAQFTSGGVTDATFGDAGVLKTDSIRPVDMQRLPDGRFIVIADDINGGFPTIWRYTAAGAVDTSYGVNGKRELKVPGWPDPRYFANRVAVAADGSAAVAGVYVPTPFPGEFDWAHAKAGIARLTPDGALDTAWDDDGWLLHAGGGSTDVNVSVGLQDDGKVIMGGLDSEGLYFRRYTPEGDPDPSFGNTATDGLTTFSVDHEGGASRIEVQPDGFIMAAGSSGQEYSEWGVWRLESDGTPDDTFGGGDGLAQVYAEDSYRLGVADFEVQADGRILLGGTTTNDSAFTTARATLVRLTASGALDGSFAGDGVVMWAPPDAGSEARLHDLEITDGGTRVLASADGVFGSSYWWDIRKFMLTDVEVPEPPTVTGAPTYLPARSPHPGERLTVDFKGTWTGADSYSYRWERCDSGGASPIGCAVAKEGPEDFYDVVAGDLDDHLRVVVTGVNPAGAASAASATRQVTEAPSDTEAPMAIQAPTLSPDDYRVTVGTKLAIASDAIFSGTPVPTITARRWQRCDGGGDPATCADIDGATGLEYVTGPADVDRLVRLRVTATNSVGSASAESAFMRVDPAPGGGAGGGGGGGGGTTPAGPVAPGGTPLPGRFDGDSTVLMPEVRGMDIDTAEDTIRLAGVHAVIEDVVRTGKAPVVRIGGKKVTIKPGEVYAQSLAAGSLVSTRQSAPRKIRLVIHWDAKSCRPARISGSMKGIDLDEVFTLLKASHCSEKRLDIDFNVKSSLGEPVVRRVNTDDGSTNLVVDTPDDASLFDLLMWAGPTATGSDLTFDAKHWALSPGQENRFTVQILDRDRARWSGAKILLDGDRVGVDDEVATTNRKGIATFTVEPRRSGRMHLLAQVKDASGRRRLLGFGTVRVEKLVEKELITAGGQVFKRNAKGDYVPQKAEPVRSSKQNVGDVAGLAVSAAVLWHWHNTTRVRRPAPEAPPIVRELVEVQEPPRTPAPPTPPEKKAAATVNHVSKAEAVHPTLCQSMANGPVTGGAPMAQLVTAPLAAFKPGGDTQIVSGAGISLALNQVAVCSEAGQTLNAGGVTAGLQIKANGTGQQYAVAPMLISWAALDEAKLNGFVATNSGTLIDAQRAAVARYVSRNGFDLLEQQLAAAVISSDGASVISNDGASLIGQAGTNLSPQGASVVKFTAAVIASGGGNIISNDGASLQALYERALGLSPDLARIAAGVISSDGASVIASGGGNVIAKGTFNHAMFAYLVTGLSRDQARDVGVEINRIIANDGASFVPTSGGNIISNDGASIIANDGASLIGQAGTNLIGQAGTNLTLQKVVAGIVANTSGRVISSDGASLIGEAGTNLIGQAGTNIISSDGASVISNDGASVISSGTMNLVPLAAALGIDPGKLNVLGDQLARVIASGGGNVIASGGGNIQASLGAFSGGGRLEGVR